VATLAPSGATGPGASRVAEPTSPGPPARAVNHGPGATITARAANVARTANTVLAANAVATASRAGATRADAVFNRAAVVAARAAADRGASASGR
jgi:hypothetical protein